MITEAILAAFTATLVDGATLKGRATLRGEPVERATLLIYRGSLSARQATSGKPYDEARSYWWEGYGPHDPFWLSKPAAQLALAGDGLFEIRDLPPHRYRLVIETDGGDRRAIDPLTLVRNAASTCLRLASRSRGRPTSASRR